MVDHRAPEHHYVAYIDESGDDGLARVKPIDSPGASEWLIIAAVVIDAAREPDVPTWAGEILKDVRSTQLQNLHFHRLEDWRRVICCGHIAKRPLRCFVVASNKKNMRGHRNPNAAKVPANAWFYCWMTRVLLERITHFVATDSMRRHGSIKRVKLEYSERGGIRYGQMAAYYAWIREQSRSENLFVKTGDLVWEQLTND